MSNPTNVLKIRSTGLSDNATSREDSALNYEVIRLVLFGFATDAIAHRTGLTHSQVQNRVRMYQLQGFRSLFRRGHTPQAQQVMKVAMTVPSQSKTEEKNRYQAIRDSVLETFRKVQSSLDD
jgi:hypothetical protein